MFFRKREKHVTIRAQIENEWSFHIKATAADAFGALGDWIGIIKDNADGGSNAPVTRQPVGFHRSTPAVDPGEAEADTQHAAPHDDGGDDD